MRNKIIKLYIRKDTPKQTFRITAIFKDDTKLENIMCDNPIVLLTCTQEDILKSWNVDKKDYHKYIKKE